MQTLRYLHEENCHKVCPRRLGLPPTSSASRSILHPECGYSAPGLVLWPAPLRAGERFSCLCMSPTCRVVAAEGAWTLVRTAAQLQVRGSSSDPSPSTSIWVTAASEWPYLAEEQVSSVGEAWGQGTSNLCYLDGRGDSQATLLGLSPPPSQLPWPVSVLSATPGSGKNMTEPQQPPQSEWRQVPEVHHVLCASTR